MTTPPSDDERAGKTRPASSSSRTALLVGLALAVGLVLGIVIGRQSGCQPSPPAPVPDNATAQRERDEAGLERASKEVDQAISLSLAAVKADARQVKVQSVETRHVPGPSGVPGPAYRHQTIRLPALGVNRQALHGELARQLAALAPTARLVETPGHWDISLGAAHTHRLILPEAEKPARPEAPRAAGRLVIVIDDMGEDVALAQGLARLGAPVVFSIWPDSGQREAVLRIAKAAGREIMVHMPMQPKGYPQVNPGKNALLVTMTADQIHEAVRQAAAKVSGAIGMNNHMGSQFTENPFGMHAALSAMKESGLCFLDSRTTAESVGPREARRVGLRFYHRDVFLDNELKVPAILGQLRKAEALAREKGQAVAIGHPHPETLRALQEWLKAKDGGVHVVTLTSISPQ